MGVPRAMAPALQLAALLLALSLAAKFMGADTLSDLARAGARQMLWLFLGFSAVSLLLTAWRPTGQRSQTRKDIIMDWDRIAGNWKQLKGRLKEQWGKLTDDDIAQLDGTREQLEGKIQERYGYGKDQARQEIDSWSRRIG